MSKKYEVAMNAYYEKRDAISECTDVLNGEIPNSKLEGASGRINWNSITDINRFWPFFQQKNI